MTKPLKDQRQLTGLHYPLPTCYHGGNPICKHLCGHGPRHNGLLHAIATTPDLAAKINAHYQHQPSRLLTFIGQHEQCLFPQDTERGLASTQQETSDPIPSLPVGRAARSGS